ncbi:MAG: universal stress protein [Desulfobacterales bacterium]|jgi:nucleotide-binding universal stress UspA family protein|nr:universal stress protein [Desulfobacterales bacterium]
MEANKKILFGVDESDFARQALAATGDLEKRNSELAITIFHGLGGPGYGSKVKMLGLSPDETEKIQQLLIVEGKNILKKAEETLVASGFDPRRISTIFEQDITDPSETMIKLADSRGFETIAVGRWGATTVSRQILGTITYRLTSAAVAPIIWVVDPRVVSKHVLVTLIGAPVGQRIVDYTVRYFGHLKESRFTFFHVIPMFPHQCRDYDCIPGQDGFEALKEKMGQWLAEEKAKVTRFAEEAISQLIECGVPEQNITLKLVPQEKGVARDILKELNDGNHGILVIGRKGAGNIQEFGLGSKVNKLLPAAQTFITCIVS